MSKNRLVKKNIFFDFLLTTITKVFAPKITGPLFSPGHQVYRIIRLWDEGLGAQNPHGTVKAMH